MSNRRGAAPEPFAAGCCVSLAKTRGAPPWFAAARGESDGWRDVDGDDGEH